MAERERIAREMHDGLAQVLGYVNTKSQAIEELLLAGRTDEARGLLAELAAAARSIYVDVREAILGLRSPVVPGVGLDRGGRGVRRHASPRRSKIVVSVDASADARAVWSSAPEVEAQVFRIVQEALTNVRKHSGARRADIVFAVVDGRLDVVIADDGHGLEAAPSDARIDFATVNARCASERTASARRSIGRIRRAVAAGSRSTSRRGARPWSRPGIV